MVGNALFLNFIIQNRDSSGNQINVNALHFLGKIRGVFKSYK